MELHSSGIVDVRQRGVNEPLPGQELASRNGNCWLRERRWVGKPDVPLVFARQRISGDPQGPEFDRLEFEAKALLRRESHTATGKSVGFSGDGGFGILVISATRVAPAAPSRAAQ